MIYKLGLVALVAGLGVAGASAVPQASATAKIADASGKSVGSATLTDTPSGLLVTGDLSGIPAGVHGIHLHAVGKCEAPFTSAGGHFNPNSKKHGYKSADGPHMGDMPNVSVAAAGSTHFEFFVPGVSLNGTNALLDADGAAIVVHATADDYMTDPAGNSGARIACGVITGG